MCPNWYKALAIGVGAFTIINMFSAGINMLIVGLERKKNNTDKVNCVGN